MIKAIMEKGYTRGSFKSRGLTAPAIISSLRPSKYFNVFSRPSITPLSTPSCSCLSFVCESINLTR